MHTAHALDLESSRDAFGEFEGEGEEEEEEEGATDAGAQLSPRAPPQCRAQKSESLPAAAKLSCALCQRQFESADALHFHYLRVHHSAPSIPIDSCCMHCNVC